MLHNEDYMKIFHEIKNNVTIINSSLQLLEKNHPELQNYVHWQDSMREVTRLRSIVLELSQTKIASGLKLVTVNICDFVEELCHSFQSVELEGHHVSFHIEHKENPLFVRVDPYQIRHALLNLVKNACEAMGYQDTIDIRTDTYDHMAQIHIIDHGGGLLPKIKKDLFKPFLTSKENGTGLGLVIAREVVDAHQGYLNWDSREGDGCTFLISLPLYP